MKIRHEILIDADRRFVWAAFNDPENLARWQPTLCRVEPVTGIPGRVGAIAKRVYEEDGRTVEIEETVTERREQHFLACVYDSKWGKALIVNHFEDAADERTRWQVYANHSFSGPMKFLALLTAGRIRQRMEDDLHRFKLMVESDNASQGS